MSGPGPRYAGRLAIIQIAPPEVFSRNLVRPQVLIDKIKTNAILNRKTTSHNIINWLNGLQSSRGITVQKHTIESPDRGIGIR